MGWLSALTAVLKAIAALLGLVRQESELAAGRAEQRSADLAAQKAEEDRARQVEQEAEKRHAADDSDSAFEDGFWRKD